MSTVTRKNRARNWWLEIPATWPSYLRMLRGREEKATPRDIHRNRRLAIASLGLSHAYLKNMLTRMREHTRFLRDVGSLSTGSLTHIKSDCLRNATVPGLSFDLTRIDQVRSRNRVQMQFDPPPDLARAIVASQPLKHALYVDAALGVREVSVCTQEALQMVVLQGSEGDREAETHRSRPALPLKAPAPWVHDDSNQSEPVKHRAFMTYAMEHLAEKENS